jgi:hypothetical protein
MGLAARQKIDLPALADRSNVTGPSAFAIAPGYQNAGTCRKPETPIN